ncbi:uncharacterized protein LOC144451373 isoform X2 [Glandiceps talaboti]
MTDTSVNQVIIFHGMCVLAGNCSERQYLHDEICCQKCKPGYFVAANCSESMDTQCMPCLPGYYSNDWTADNLCKELNPCNISHAYIAVPASANNTHDNICSCEDGYHVEEIKELKITCKENPICPPGQGIHAGQCKPCENDHYSDTWSRVEACRQQPKCRENGLSIEMEGNATFPTICINISGEVIPSEETAYGNLSTRRPGEKLYTMKNILNETVAQDTVAMTTTMSSLTLMSIIANKPSEETSINYRLIVVCSIVGGGFLIVVFAFFVTEVRRIIRRKKGLLPSSYTRTKNSKEGRYTLQEGASKGMVVNFADKRRADVKDNSSRKLNETENDEINENTPMLVDNRNNIDLSVIIWEPIRQYDKHDEQNRAHDEWTENNEERVTCV